MTSQEKDAWRGLENLIFQTTLVIGGGGVLLVTHLERSQPQVNKGRPGLRSLPGLFLMWTFFVFKKTSRISSLNPS